MSVIVAGHERSKPCQPLSGVPGAWRTEAASTCLGGPVGPLTLTDLGTAGGCAHDLMLVAGDVEQPKWFLLVRAGASGAVSSGRFVVPEDEPVTLVARGNSLRPDAACAITWSYAR